MKNSIDSNLTEEEKVLSAWLDLYPLQNYALSSRIHPLKTFGKHWWVKRDDELSFGIAGSKIRKYASLITDLKARQDSEIVLYGSLYSNHILGLSQLLIENGLNFRLFLKGSLQALRGNAWWTQLLVPQERIEYVKRDESVEQIAQRYVDEQLATGKSAILIPEGGCCLQSLPGAMTLALDLLRNEREQSLRFKHVFIDAGTGLTAFGLLLGLAIAKRTFNVHVLLTAEAPDKFLAKYRHFAQALNLPLYPSFECFQPKLGRSFGSTNRTLFHYIQAIARQEGIFLDPLYSAKLFYEAYSHYLSQLEEAETLLIHSGGALSLTGFSRAFELENSLI